MPGENPGILFNVKTMSDADLAVSSFGQGNAVTPIQQVMAAAAIANGGTLMKPMIVKEIRDENGDLVKEMQPKKVRQVITEDTAAELSIAWPMASRGVQGLRHGGRLSNCRQDRHS